MPQLVRPTSDVSIGDWRTQAGGSTNLYATIDETVADSADYVQSSVVPDASPLEVTIGSAPDPGVSTGYHVRYRYRASVAGGNTMKLTATLKQGAVTITSWEHVDIGTAGVADVDADQTLTAAEADAITDHSALRVDLVAVRAGLPVTPANNIFFSVGDSISVASGSNVSGAYGYRDARLLRTFNTSGNVGGFFAYALILPKTGQSTGNGRMYYGGIAAVGGYTCAQIRTLATLNGRSLYQVGLESGCGWVVLMAGTNDILFISDGAGGFIQANLDAVMADITAMWDGYTANGQVCVACTLLGNNEPNAGGAVLALNAAIRDAAVARGLPLADLFVPTGNPANGNWLSSAYAANGTDPDHPSAEGARLAGQALRDAIDGYLTGDPPLVQSGADSGGTIIWHNGAFVRDTDADNNPNGGTTQGAEFDDAWNLTLAGAAFSYITDAAVYSGRAWQIDKTATPGSASNALTNGAIPPVVVAGNDFDIGYIMAVPARTSASTLVTLTHYWQSDGGNTLFTLQLRGETTAIAPFKLWVPKRVVPDLMTNVRTHYEVSGDLGQARLGQLTMRYPA